MEQFITKSKRLKRYLYILGFEFQQLNTNTGEQYIFNQSNELNESIEFYYKIRKTFQNKN